MSEDFDDGASAQPLKTGVLREGFLVWPVRQADPPPDKPTVTVVMHKDAAALRASISAEDLALWRAEMRSRPPEPAAKPGKRAESAWEKPQEWNRP